jgi:DNA polymerase
LPVLGEGALDAAIMLIGEAPGEKEAKTGRPFVGASGRFLDELIRSAGFQRSEFYITNILKDRPPGNRDPNREEIDIYAPLLMKQIEIIEPKVIATLGRFAMDFILGQFLMAEQGMKITQLHGRRLHARAPYGRIYVVPLFHPAAAIYNQDLRETLRQDFQTLKSILRS